MDQLCIFVIVLNSTNGFFFSFILTCSKISACRSEEHNNRATGKGKQGFYFHRKMKYLFQFP